MTACTRASRAANSGGSRGRRPGGCGPVVELGRDQAPPRADRRAPQAAQAGPHRDLVGREDRDPQLGLEGRR